MSSVVLLYLCARMWGHGSTLEERGSKELLGRVARLGAPVVFLLLLAQTWGSTSIHLQLSGNFLPQLQIGLLTRLEWTADIAVFALLVVSLAGTVAVAALRRIERLDDVTAET